MKNLIPALAGVALCAIPAEAQPGSSLSSAQLEPSLHFQTGHIALRDFATIDLPDKYRFLPSADARFLLETVWGNRPDPEVLGMIIPPGEKVPDCWAMVLSYEAEGFVKDDDARSIDYDDLLKQMQQDTRKHAAESRKQGYPVADLLGWAEPPHYDSASHKLYWAKRLKFDGDPEVTLNYDVRILGRRGVLVLTAVASDHELSMVAPACQTVLAGTNFTAGNRYEDFDSSIDKIAAYGIGGLIAGKLLVKAGIIKLLLKPILIVGAVIAATLGKIFRRAKAA